MAMLLNYGKSPSLVGKSTMNGPFSIGFLYVDQRVKTQDPCADAQKAELPGEDPWPGV